MTLAIKLLYWYHTHSPYFIAYNRRTNRRNKNTLSYLRFTWDSIGWLHRGNRQNSLDFSWGNCLEIIHLSAATVLSLYHSKVVSYSKRQPRSIWQRRTPDGIAIASSAEGWNGDVPSFTRFPDALGITRLTGAQRWDIQGININIASLKWIRVENTGVEDLNHGVFRRLNPWVFSHLACTRLHSQFRDIIPKFKLCRD